MLLLAPVPWGVVAVFLPGMHQEEPGAAVAQCGHGERRHGMPENAHSFEQRPAAWNFFRRLLF